MGRFHFCHTTLCLIAFACLDAKAQESKLKLPDDGWWVTYSIRHSATNGSGKRLMEQTKTQTYSFFGTLKDGDEVCRWIETKTVTLRDGMESTYFRKLLISEKDLLESDDPFNKFKRGWTKGKSGIREAKLRLQGRRGFDDPSLFFPGARQNAQEVIKERSVDYQRGHLKLAQAKMFRTSPIQWQDFAGKYVLNWTEVIDYTIWSDATTSPLFSAATIQANYTQNGELNTIHNEDIELQDFGTNAKSELPEHN